MRTKVGHIIIMVMFVWGIFSPDSFAGLDDFDTSNSAVNLNQFMSGGPSKDGIPSLDEPRFLPAAEADFLRDDDQVVGIVIDGQAKAYPIRILNWHEIVNDRVSERPIAVTWCPLTRSAVTFDRQMKGQTLEFGVSGLLYNSNVVMYDRQTEGLWSQLKMGGLTGTFAQDDLRAIPSRVIAWKKWREEFPETLVLSIKTGHGRDYDRDPYAHYHSNQDVMFSVGKLDQRLQPKDLVVGVKVNNVAKAYLLRKVTGLDEPLNDTVGETEIYIRPLKGEAVEVSDKDGNILPSVVAYWFAWKVFNKETLVY